MASVVLHEDEGVVAVDKPAGIAVVPARGEPAEDSLVRRLAAERGERLFPVHRIDRDTSGVVVFARSADAHRELNRAFEQRRVEKEYVAFAAGRVQPARGRIEIALHAARRGKTRPALPGEPGTQEAVTDYVEERFFGRREVSRLRLFPCTGRHHQIRVHLRARGAPILFDACYGRATLALLAGAGAPCARLALHAARLVLPTAAGPLRIEAPLAPDLVALEAWLAEAGAL